MEHNDWYAPLRAITAKGLHAPKAQRLADLHERRRVHEGQFFTPEPLARYIGRLVESLVGQAHYKHSTVRLLDTSIGSGRLFAWCDPARHVLAGFDIDTDAVRAVAKAAAAAGFDHDIRCASLEEMRVRGYDMAIINPPFGLHLETPLLEAFPSNSFGRFGPASSAVSHEYALVQALAGASMVVAILPQTFAREAQASPAWNSRLVAVLDLPEDTFTDEGANVRTSLLVWGCTSRGERPLVTGRVASFDEEPPAIAAGSLMRGFRAHMHSVCLADNEPTITLPVTGDNTVRVAHAGRRLVIHYRCGLTQAKVHNAILRRRLLPATSPEDRRPAGIDCEGQGALDLENFLIQPDPLGAWHAFVAQLVATGASIEVDPGIEGYLRRRHRRNRALAVPLQHTIKVEEGLTQAASVAVTATRRQLLDPLDWATPVIEAGTTLQAKRLDNGRYRIAIGEHEQELDERTLRQRFTVSDAGPHATDGWRVLHPGRAAAFPQRAAQVHEKIQALGINAWFDWRYQEQDLVELLTVPCSAIVAWDPALGKTRLAVALALASPGRTLAVVEPHVLDQYADEIASLPLPAGFCKVVRSPRDLEDGQARLLLISYNRLRQELYPRAGRRTYARALRHRIHNLIADEGHRLGTTASDQSRAVRLVAARRKYALTGTPIQNLPRDTLWLASWLYGDGTVLQPYGVHHPHLTASLLRSMSFARRGLDEFREAFVTTEWVTNEFKEDMTKGAKREIPVLKSETLFRQWLAPMLLRRVKGEPMVAPYFKQVAPRIRTITVPWDREHLAAYVRTADEFAAWYRQARKDAADAGRHVNLTMVLARIGAVAAAANHPHRPYKDALAYTPVTSKQRAIVERIDELVRQGHTVLTFAMSPAVITRLDGLLHKRGHTPVLLHGERAQADRTRDLRECVHTGQAKVILATYGTSKTGLNLPQADRVILTCRGWTPMIEDQAIQRVLRCQQQREVEVEIFELAGSLDIYQAQMVQAKRAANASAIDVRAQDHGVEFLHLDTILGRFLEALARRDGFECAHLRQQLQLLQEVA